MKHLPKPTKKTYQLIHPVAPVVRGFCIVHVQYAEKNFHFFFEIRGNQKKLCLLFHVSSKTPPCPTLKNGRQSPNGSRAQVPSRKSLLEEINERKTQEQEINCLLAVLFHVLL